MNSPNKTTVIAVALYAIEPVVVPAGTPENASRPVKPLWGSLPAQEQMRFSKASELLSQYTYGAAFSDINHAELAAKVEKLLPDIKANANDVVELFLNLHANLQ
jgi:hypothetical protein